MYDAFKDQLPDIDPDETEEHEDVRRAGVSERATQALRHGVERVGKFIGGRDGVEIFLIVRPETESVLEIDPEIFDRLTPEFLDGFLINRPSKPRRGIFPLQLFRRSGASRGFRLEA